MGKILQAAEDGELGEAQRLEKMVYREWKLRGGRGKETLHTHSFCQTACSWVVSSDHASIMLHTKSLRTQVESRSLYAGNQ